MLRGGVLAVIAFAIAALAPAAAQARLVYVRHPASAHPEVWTARDGGGHRRHVGDGSFPAISAGGERVAWVTFGRREAVWIAPGDGSGRARRVVRASTIGDIAFSPDGTRLAVALPHHLAVFDTATRRHVISDPGRIRGFSFSPDSSRLVYGRAGSDDIDARTDLHETPVDDAQSNGLTADGRSLNPIWGADGTIVFDRETLRKNDAPVFQLFSLDPATGHSHRITHMRVPSLLSGLVPLELSADGSRLLAEFVGQDTSLGYTIDMRSGRVRALSRRLEQGFVAADLSPDGRTVLGSTGGPDPAAHHDVVTVPFRGGHPTVLVRNAALPHWSD